MLQALSKLEGEKRQLEVKYASEQQKNKQLSTSNAEVRRLCLLN